RQLITPKYFLYAEELKELVRIQFGVALSIEDSQNLIRKDTRPASEIGDGAEN
ncbi:hypothetical protein OnM2_023035, partial [Erysiphe neolycopersici]